MDQSASQGPNLSRILQALKRFRWLILGLTAAGLAGGYVATRYIEPEYVVGATIWIESPSKERDAGPIRGEELLQAQAWVELLRTYQVLDPVVRERKLYLTAARGADSILFRGFNLADRFLPGEYELAVDKEVRTLSLRNTRRLVSETATVGDSLGQRLGFLWVPRPARSYAGKTIRFQVLTPREASVLLSEKLTSVLREQNFLSVQLTGIDPEDAALTLNHLIRRFVDEAAKQKRQKLTLLAGVLDSQVIDQAQKLKNAEEGLEAFRVGTVTLPREEAVVAPGLQFTQPTVYSQYFALRTDLEAVKRDRKAIEEVLGRAREGAMAVDAFNTIPAVKSAPDLQRVLSELSVAEADLRTMLTKYTDEYKGVRDLKEKIASIRGQTIPLYANALVEQLKTQERDLSDRISNSSRELREIPSRSQNEARLRREVEQSEALFKSLESSRQQARLAEASSIPDVRILDSAVAPTQPSRNTTGRLLFLGLVGGLGLGLGLAILLDLLDRRLRYPEQVSEGLGVPILGTIPQIKHGGLAGPEEAAQVIEAFRSVRLNLTHSFPPGAPITLAISSPSPSDGKSLISANLALSFAEAGYNTLVVDGDTRRGDLHRTFAVERRPGLLDYLAGDADISRILRPTSHARLMLIPCGARRHEGPELLGSARMQDLMTILRGRFDVVIVDTPPLGAGIDPFVLGTATGNLALVLRAGETDRQLAEAKLQVLDRLPVRLLGAILNDVQIGKGAYKYYSYSYGYVTSDEGKAGSLPAVTT
jgi:capsular exopolysaccharide synthesis family protein